MVTFQDVNYETIIFSTIKSLSIFNSKLLYFGHSWEELIEWLADLTIWIGKGEKVVFYLHWTYIPYQFDSSRFRSYWSDRSWPIVSAVFLNEDLFRGHYWSSLNHCITTGHAVSSSKLSFNSWRAWGRESVRASIRRVRMRRAKVRRVTRVSLSHSQRDFVAQQVGVMH